MATGKKAGAGKIPRKANQSIEELIAESQRLREQAAEVVARMSELAEKIAGAAAGTTRPKKS